MRAALVFLLASIAVVVCNGQVRQRTVRLVPPANLTITCLGSKVTPALWFHPNGTRVQTTGRITVDADGGTLRIDDANNRDCGVYYCVTLESEYLGTAREIVLVNVYSTQPRTYEERALIGGLAALCILTVVVFVALVVRFRYRAPKKTTPAENYGFHVEESSATSF